MARRGVRRARMGAVLAATALAGLLAAPGAGAQPADDDTDSIVPGDDSSGLLGLVDPSMLGLPLPVPRSIPPLSSDPAPSATAGARQVSATFITDRMVDLVIESTAMAGEHMDVRLLLPKDWYTQPNATFPSLYLLSGYGRDVNQVDWVDFADIEQFMADKNVLVVMPENGRAGMFSDWWNYGQGGAPAWETFHTTEIPDVLAKNWRTSTKASVAGISMGGYGAIEYTTRHPELFGAAASYSGYLYTTNPLMAPYMQVALADRGVDPWAVWGDPVLQRSIWEEHDPFLNASALAGKPIYVYSALGMRGEHDAPLLEEIADMFSLNLEEVKQPVLATALETLSNVTSREFAAEAERAGAQVTASFPSAGTHQWKYWQDEFKRSWPVLAEGLGIDTSDYDAEDAIDNAATDPTGDEDE